jgi:hypothetical protein
LTTLNLSGGKEIMANIRCKISGKNHPGVEAVFILRQPTSQEIQVFRSVCKYSRPGIMDSRDQERCNLFDRLLVEVKNLLGVEGRSITVARKAEIPEKWKIACIEAILEGGASLDTLRDNILTGEKGGALWLRLAVR